jgi:hypothetical protein
MRKWLASFLVVPVLVALLALHESVQAPAPPEVVAPVVAIAPPAPRVRREPPPAPPSPAEQQALEDTRLHPQLAGKVDAIYRRVAGRAPSETELAFWTRELVLDRPEALVDEYVGLLDEAIATVYRRPPTFGQLRRFTDFLDAGSPL